MFSSLRKFAWPIACLLVSACCALLIAFFASQQQSPSELAPTFSPLEAAPIGPLSGMRIAIDAGHGGYDGGAVGRKNHVEEKGLNLDVALRLRTLLRDQGAQIILTRDGDYALCDANPPIRKKLQDMQRRALLITRCGADLLISIHMNEYANGRESGPQVFFREGCPAGKLLASTIQTAMVAGLKPSKSRQINTGDYMILTLGLPSVLVECGFLSNAKEEALLSQPDYREQVAHSICDGVLAWSALPDHPKALPPRDR